METEFEFVIRRKDSSFFSFTSSERHLRRSAQCVKIARHGIVGTVFERASCSRDARPTTAVGSCRMILISSIPCPVSAGLVRHAGTVVHAQVQTAALGIDRGQSARSARRHCTVVRAVSADDRQRVPVRPDAQWPVLRSGDGRAHETHTQPQAPEVDMPADHGRGAAVYGCAADEASRGRRIRDRVGNRFRHRPVVRHTATVVVAQRRWNRKSAVFVRVQRFAGPPVVVLFVRQKGEKQRRQKEQKEMHGQLFLQLPRILFGRGVRLTHTTPASTSSATLLLPFATYLPLPPVRK